MRYIILAAAIFYGIVPLSGQGLFDTPLTLTNRKTVPIRTAPLKGRLDFALSMGSWQSELSTLEGFDKDRNPSNSVRLFTLGYTRFLTSGIGFDGHLIREEETGWGIRARGLYRIEPGKKEPVGEGGLLLAAGVFFVKNNLYDDTPVLLFTWGIEWGHRFRSYLKLNVDGFFFVPWSPGFELSPFSSFRLEGQLRFGVFGLSGEIDLLNREYDPSIDRNVRCITAKGGLVVFSRTDWKISVRGGMMQKALLEGSGSSNHLVGFRNAMFEEFAFSGRYRDRVGNLFTYSWGIQVILFQNGKNSSGMNWDEGFGEVSFFFSGSLSL